ncbi:hypothetical protein BJX65DRAFT_301096 [Aspergillus insuetus]
MHIHKMNLLLAAIWLDMMAVGVVGDAIPTSVDGGLDNTEPIDTTATAGLKLTGWGIIHSTNTEFPIPHPTATHGSTWNDPVDENGIPLPHFPYHPHAKKAETDVEVEVESVPSLCGDGWNDSEDGHYVPGIPFHPGHGHHPTPCPSICPRPSHTLTARGVTSGDGWNDNEDDNGLYIAGIPFHPGHGHHPTTAATATVAPRDVDTSVSTSVPSTLSTVATHENIELCGDGWNDSEDGLYVPGIPFHPGHGHHPTPCPSLVDKMGKREEIAQDIDTPENDKIDGTQDGEEIITPFGPVVTCYHGELVDDGPINKAIRELRKRKGTPTAGVRQCLRVWCQEGLCVKWCNDDSKLRTLSSYKNIGDDVFAVMNNCHPLDGRVSGMVKHHDKWRTIVHKDDC